MSPEQIAKDSESSHQKALFAWCNMAAMYGFEAADDMFSYTKPKHAETRYGTDNAVACLRWIYHIPNGGSRGDTDKSRKIRGANLKAEGTKDGICDINLPFPQFAYPAMLEIFGNTVKPISGIICGLYIEMKKPSAKAVRATSKGGVSDNQKTFMTYAKNAGYSCFVCYNWMEAKEIIKRYINGG